MQKKKHFYFTTVISFDLFDLFYTVVWVCVLFQTQQFIFIYLHDFLGYYF